MKLSEIPETRGRTRKYHFHKMKVGDVQTFDVDIVLVLSALNYWKKAEGNNWNFKAYTDKATGAVNLVRIK